MGKKKPPQDKFNPVDTGPTEGEDGAYVPSETAADDVIVDASEEEIPEVQDEDIDLRDASRRRRGRLDLLNMAVVYDDRVYPVEGLPGGVMDWLLLSSLRAHINRYGAEGYEQLLAGETRRKRGLGVERPVSMMRSAIKNALIERGMHPDDAAAAANGMNKSDMTKLRMDPDVAKHYAKVKGTPDLLSSIVRVDDAA